MRETIASRGRPLSSAVRTDLLHLARATSSLQLPDQIGTPSAEAGVHAAAPATAATATPPPPASSGACSPAWQRTCSSAYAGVPPPADAPTTREEEGEARPSPPRPPNTPSARLMSPIRGSRYGVLLERYSEPRRAATAAAAPPSAAWEEPLLPRLGTGSPSRSSRAKAPSAAPRGGLRKQPPAAPPGTAATARLGGIVTRVEEGLALDAEELALLRAAVRPPARRPRPAPSTPAAAPEAAPRGTEPSPSVTVSVQPTEAGRIMDDQPLAPRPEAKGWETEFDAPTERRTPTP